MTWWWHICRLVIQRSYGKSPCFICKSSFLSSINGLFPIANCKVPSSKLRNIDVENPPFLYNGETMDFHGGSTFTRVRLPLLGSHPWEVPRSLTDIEAVSKIAKAVNRR